MLSISDVRTLAKVHACGIHWSDCRPANLAMYNGFPLLLDWNCAVPLYSPSVMPLVGSRCFAAQRLLRAEGVVEPLPEDDTSSRCIKLCCPFWMRTRFILIAFTIALPQRTARPSGWKRTRS